MKKEDGEVQAISVGEVGVKAAVIATWGHGWGSCGMIKGRHGISSLSPCQDDDGALEGAKAAISRWYVLTNVLYCTDLSHLPKPVTAWCFASPVRLFDWRL